MRILRIFDQASIIPGIKHVKQISRRQLLPNLKFVEPAKIRFKQNPRNVALRAVSPQPTCDTTAPETVSPFSMQELYVSGSKAIRIVHLECLPSLERPHVRCAVPDVVLPGHYHEHTPSPKYPHPSAKSHSKQSADFRSPAPQHVPGSPEHTGDASTAHRCV